MKRRIFGIVCVCLAFIILATVAYRNSTKRDTPIVFSAKNMLDSLWHNYKQDNLEQGSGRTLDKQRGNITTSEGESYTMLRSVWLDDKATFDQSLNWSKDNLMHKDDKLFSWLFGQKADGTYGVLTEQNGQNSASDGDQDIALALIFASKRWQDEHYLDDARALLNDIWDKEVIIIDGVPYLTADDVEKGSLSKTAVLNPSYFSPASYRIFAQVDSTHPWLKLVDSSYTVLQLSSSLPLGSSKSAGLPPNWVTIDKTSGTLSASPTQGLTTDYSFDALRVPWRVALDWKWFNEPRAYQYLSSLSFLGNQWMTKNLISTSYKHDGTVIDDAETPAMYGGAIGYFIVVDSKNGADVYKRKLESLYDPDSHTWKYPTGYYDDNWAWFGIALYNDLLPNLYK